MAYSSRGSSRGRSGGGGGGGGQNMMPYAVAGILVVLVVVLFMVMSSSKKKSTTQSASTTEAPKNESIPQPPPKASEKPYPPVPESRRAEADKIVSTADSTKSRAEALYKEANEAKKTGDTAKWQSKLKEMRTLLENLKDQWNEFVATMPVSRDYDTEDVAKHYFPSQSGKVQAALKLLAASKSDEK